MSVCLFAFLRFDLSLVELELLALQNVAVTSAALARSGRYTGQQPPSPKLLLQGWLHLRRLLTHFILLLRFLRPLLVDAQFFLRRQFGALLAAERDRVVRFVPAAVRRAVNGYNAVLDERLRSHQLVVTGVVDDVEHTGLTRYRF